jgi:hypothetical protein
VTGRTQPSARLAIHETTKEIPSRLFRVTIMLLIALIGVICFFTLPDLGMAICGSCLMISFSYMCVLYRLKGQRLESIILLTVIGSTIAAFFAPSNFGGILFLPLLAYPFYGMGRAFIIKEIREAFRDSKWTHRAKKRNS